MKEVTHYICELCHTEYSNKTKAQKCEEGHCKPVEIIKSSYLGFESYPHGIMVKMDDGTECIYIPR